MNPVAFTPAQYDAVTRNARIVTLSIVITSFLIVGAIIVIGSASLCLTLPGINVMTDVLYPGIFPGLLVLAMAFPLSSSSWNYSKRLNKSHKEMIDSVIHLFNLRNVPAMKEKDPIKAVIMDELLNEDWSKDWRKEGKSKLLKDVEKYYSKDGENPNELIVEVLQKVQEEIMKP